jgi:hypothetical protein
MENLVLPFMNEGQMAHSSKTPHFMGSLLGRGRDRM